MVMWPLVRVMWMELPKTTDWAYPIAGTTVETNIQNATCRIRVQDHE
jgi:hypothetical protein